MDKIVASKVEQERGVELKRGRLSQESKKRRALGEITNVRECKYGGVLVRKADYLDERMEDTRESTGRNRLSEIKRRSSIPKRHLAIPAEPRCKVPRISAPDVCIQLNQEERERVADGGELIENVREYSYDVHIYLLHLEREQLPEEDHLRGQIITPKNRVVLVNWMCQVAEFFTLNGETLQMAVMMVDRYMSRRSDIDKGNFQLLGITVLFIAIKYEEVLGVESENIVDLCNGAFTVQDLLDMERRVLDALEFRLGVPTPLLFLRRYSYAANSCAVVHNFSKFLLELALHFYPLCSYRGSLIAAAASLISIYLFNPCDLDSFSALWSEHLISYSSYTFDDIRPVVRILSHSIIDAGGDELKSVHLKYSKSDLFSVSKHLPKAMSTIKHLATY